jgi:hypothetical protein
MYSESDPAVERSAASAAVAAGGGAAARGPRAAHPASSVTANATDILLTRIFTESPLGLVFLAQTRVATSDVENEQYAENREQNNCGSGHLTFSFTGYLPISPKTRTKLITAGPRMTM